MTGTKATYAAIFGLTSLLGLGSGAEAYQMVFRPAPMPVQTFRSPTPTFRPAPTFHAPTYHAPTFHPTFRASPTVHSVPRTVGTLHQRSHISRSTGSRLISTPISRPSTSRQHGERISRPPVHVPRLPGAGKNPGFGLNVKPPFPPAVHPHHRPHPRLVLPYPYPGGQSGPVAPDQQIAQPDQLQDVGETAQEDPGQYTQDDAAQATPQNDTVQATQDDAAQTEEQPAEVGQDHPAQAPAERYAQTRQVQPSQTAHRRRRPAAVLAPSAQGQPGRSTEEPTQLTDDAAGQVQEAPEPTAEDDPGQSEQEEVQMTGEAYDDNGPNEGPYTAGK